MDNDLISRKAAIDVVKDRLGNGYIVNSIKKLPSMQPQERHGEWIEVYDADENPLFGRKFDCSCCHKWNTYGQSDYCPHCGAKMEVRNLKNEEDTDTI